MVLLQAQQVFLTFASRRPPSIKMVGVNSPVQRYLPNPYRCKSCWCLGLGHTISNCDSSSANYKNCGRRLDNLIVLLTPVNRSLSLIPPIIDTMKSQIAILQAEMREIKEKTLPSMSENITASQTLISLSTIAGST